MDENGDPKRPKLTKAEKKDLKQQQKKLRQLQKEILKREKLELKALTKALARDRSISLKTNRGSPILFGQSSDRRNDSPTSFVDDDGWAITPHEVTQTTISQAEVNGGSMNLDTIASVVSRASSRRSFSSPLQQASKITSTSTTPTKHNTPLKLEFATPAARTPARTNVLQNHQLNTPNTIGKTPKTKAKANKWGRAKTPTQQTTTPTQQRRTDKEQMILDPIDQLSPFSQVVRKASDFVHEFLPDADFSNQHSRTRNNFNVKTSPTAAEKKANFGQYHHQRRRRRSQSPEFFAQGMSMSTQQQPSYHKIKKLGGWRY